MSQELVDAANRVSAAVDNLIAALEAARAQPAPADDTVPVAALTAAADRADFALAPPAPPATVDGATAAADVTAAAPEVSGNPPS